MNEKAATETKGFKSSWNNSYRAQIEIKQG